MRVCCVSSGTSGSRGKGLAGVILESVVVPSLMLNEDGYYSSVEEYQYNDKEPIGVHLVFEHPQPVIGGRQWILNPDLVIALRLVKDGAKLGKARREFRCSGSGGS